MDVKTANSVGGDPVVVITGVTPKDVPVVNNIFGMKAYGKDKSTWFAPGMFPFGRFVLDDIKELEDIATFNKLPSVAQLDSDLEKAESSIATDDLDGYVPKIPLYEHQKSALALAIHTPRVGLFLDPGLGKTKIGCDLIMHVNSTTSKRFWLIVALKVNQFTWKNEMEFHSKEEFTLTPITKTGKARKSQIEKALQNPKSLGLVVTYDTCRVAKDLLQEIVPYTDVILDESHSLRSPRSGKTKAVLEMLSNKVVNRRLLLSGTPSLGSPMHLWGQLKALGQFLVPNSWQFQNTYALKSPFNKHIVIGWKNLDQLNELVTSISLRRTAEECLDLPERVIQTIEIEPSSKTKKIYNQVVKELPIQVGELTLSEVDNPLVAMTRLAQISSGFVYKSRKDPTICDTCPKLQNCVANDINPYTSKCSVETKDPGRDVGLVGTTEVIDSCVELVSSHVTNGKKVIVWAKHQWTLDTLVTKLGKLDVPILRYDSTTKSHAACEKMFNELDAAVIVAQISMGIGVTFKAPVMVYCELSWGLDHWLQSLDRNYGIRAKGFKSLLVQVIVIKDSLAHSVIKLLQTKIDASSMMSKSVECVTCTKVVYCLNRGIEPFDTDCILDAETSKANIPIKALR